MHVFINFLYIYVLLYNSSIIYNIPTKKSSRDIHYIYLYSDIIYYFLSSSALGNAGTSRTILIFIMYLIVLTNLLCLNLCHNEDLTLTLVDSISNRWLFFILFFFYCSCLFLLTCLWLYNNLFFFNLFWFRYFLWCRN